MSPDHAFYESQYEPTDLDDSIPDPILDLDLDGIEAPPKPKRRRAYDPLDETGVLRDRWGRPLILPDPAWKLPTASWPDGKVIKHQMADGRRPYVRVSTACKWNDVVHGLSVWRNRMSILSIARRPDLQARLCGLTYKDGKEVDSIIDEAMGRAADDDFDIEGTLVAANRGTAYHSLTVPGAPTIDPTFGPTMADYAVTARAFVDALYRCGLELIEHERFAVDHSRRTAGSVDHLAVVARETAFSRAARLAVGDACLVDKKTGDLRWISFVTQLALYARCRPTDWRDGRTWPWHDHFRPDVGIIAAASLKTGSVKIYPVETPEYLADSAIDRYRMSLADHVNGLVGRGF